MHLLFVRFQFVLAIQRRFGPLHAQNEMVVTEAVQRCDGFSSIFLPVVVDESKTLEYKGLIVKSSERSNYLT